MPPQRPTSVLVIAILHFIFGGLGLVQALIGGGLLAAGGGNMFAFQPQAQGPQAKELEYQKELMDAIAEGQGTLQPVELGGGVVLSVLMILAGIGLLQVRPWGRMLSIIYGLLSILYHIAAVVLAYTIVLPAFQEFIRRHPPPSQEAKLLADFMGIAYTIAPIFSFLPVIYPIIVLIIMFRPKVVAAFSGETQGPAMADYDDRYPQGRPEPPDERFTSGKR